MKSKSFLLILIAVISVILVIPKVKGDYVNLELHTLPNAESFVYATFDENESIISESYEQFGHREFFQLGDYRFNDFHGNFYWTEFHPYLRFILPNKTSEIVSLTLKIWIEDADPNSYSFDVNFKMNISLVSSDWNEFDMNWTHGRPEYLGEYINATIENAGVDDVHREIDLTYFKDFIENNTFSIHIKPYKLGDPDYTDFKRIPFKVRISSKEEAKCAKKPYLYIEYNELVYRQEPIPKIEPPPERRDGFTPIKESSYSISDTFVDSSIPTTNYGTNIYAWSNIVREAYFKFDITEPPENWEKAEIKLYSEKYPIGGYFDLDVYLINESWDEMTTTWNNKPKLEKYIMTLDFYYEDDYGLYFLIDVSDYVTNESTISIGINASFCQTEDNYAKIYTKEYHLNSLKPRLIWSYYEIDTPPSYIQIYPPQENQTFGEIAPTFTINQIIDDSTIVSMWYTIDNGLTNHTFASLTKTINQTDWNKQKDGEIIIRVYAEYLRGNIGCGTRIIRKETSTNGDIDFTAYLVGFSLLFGVTVIGLIGRYYFVKKK